MTAALEGGEWSAASPGHTLPPGKTRYPFYRRLGGPRGRYRRAENLVSTWIRSQTAQPVVSCYDDWATQPTLHALRTWIAVLIVTEQKGNEIQWKCIHLLYAFFWVIPRCLNFICQHFGTLCSIFIGLWRWNFFKPACVWRWNRQGVPKCQHIKFKHRGITQKKA